VAVNGLLDPAPGQTLVAALEPLARPTNAADPRSGGQRRADGLAELARRSLEAGRLPQTGGSAPSCWSRWTWTASSAPATCRRLACDRGGDPGAGHPPATNHHPGTEGGLAARLRAAAKLLPPALGGAPTQPLGVGRASRVVTATPPHRKPQRDPTAA
jgi:Domain of unknown function (DUF222)